MDELIIDAAAERAKSVIGQFLNTAETCAALRISRGTLQQRLKDGTIRRSGACKGRNLFPLEEVQRLAGVQVTR